MFDTKLYFLDIKLFGSWKKKKTKDDSWIVNNFACRESFFFNLVL